jgi:hypothetical protein
MALSSANPQGKSGKTKGMKQPKSERGEDAGDAKPKQQCFMTNFNLGGGTSVKEEIS